MLINPGGKKVKINLPAETKDASVDYVDVSTGENPIAQMQLKDTTITLKPYAVDVVNVK